MPTVSVNILHCCGWSGDKNRVEVWKNYKAAAVNWAVYVEDMDLNVGRDFFNTNCTLSNDIDLSHIKCVADTARNI